MHDVSYVNIEARFQNITESCVFPPRASGLSSFPDMYKNLKKRLEAVHSEVNIGATLSQISLWKNELAKEMDKLTSCTTMDEASAIHSNLQAMFQEYPIIYLTQHGLPHINKVIDLASTIINYFRDDESLTEFELFILLCAIQVHDLGNIYGRSGHESSFRASFNRIATPIINDTVILKTIFDIAQAHSGCTREGDLDTISSLSPSVSLSKNHDVRVRLLASILRFSDELADDHTRVNPIVMEIMDLVNDTKNGSAIYHLYADTLRLVDIKENPITKRFFVSLKYLINAKFITKKYKKGDGTVFLIDEIFYRTKKMELERRYCMRYFVDYVPITEISVNIEIYHEEAYDEHSHDTIEPSWVEPKEIQYTLRDTGFPSDNLIIEHPLNTGSKVITQLKAEGWAI